MYLQFVFMYLNTVIEIDQKPKSISIYKAITYLHPYFLSTYIFSLWTHFPNFPYYKYKNNNNNNKLLCSAVHKKAHVAL